MRVLVLGGTGLLGRHTVAALCERGHDATAVARHAPSPVGWPQRARVSRLDLMVAGRARFEALCTGHDGVVVAWGVDDRRPLPRPELDSLFGVNVDLVARLLRQARSTGVRHAVVCGSLFTWLDRAYPDLRLAHRHAYVRARREQLEAVTSIRGLRVVVLEIPFAFGAVPGRRPLWTPVVRYAASHLPLLAVPGGTTMISARAVAAAVVGGLERRSLGGPLPIGERSVAWTTWLEALAEAAGRSRRCRVLPLALAEVGARLHASRLRVRDLASGLDPLHIVRLFARRGRIHEAHLRAARRALGYEVGGLDRALAETVEAALA